MVRGHQPFAWVASPPAGSGKIDLDPRMKVRLFMRSRGMISAGEACRDVAGPAGRNGEKGKVPAGTFPLPQGSVGRVGFSRFPDGVAERFPNVPDQKGQKRKDFVSGRFSDLVHEIPKDIVVGHSGRWVEVWRKKRGEGRTVGKGQCVGPGIREQKVERVFSKRLDLG